MLIWLKGLFFKEPRSWGIVHRSGKWFPKNYGHELKNGKGLTRDEAVGKAARGGI